MSSSYWRLALACAWSSKFICLLPLCLSRSFQLLRLVLRLYTRIRINKDDHITKKGSSVCCISAIFSIVTLLQASSLVNKSALHTLRSDRHTTVYLFLLQLAATTAILSMFFRGEYTSIRDMTCPLEDIATPPWIVIGMTEACLNTLTGWQLAANGYQLAGQASYRHVGYRCSLAEPMQLSNGCLNASQLWEIIHHTLIHAVNHGVSMISSNHT